MHGEYKKRKKWRARDAQFFFFKEKHKDRMIYGGKLLGPCAEARGQKLTASLKTSSREKM